MAFLKNMSSKIRTRLTSFSLEQYQRNLKFSSNEVLVLNYMLCTYVRTTKNMY